jgi:hypothetical protein
MVRRWKLCTVLLIGLVVFANAVAYRHAWRMTHFVPAGERTLRPQKLTGWEKLGVLIKGVTVPKPPSHLPGPGHPQPARIVSIPTSDNLTLESWDIPGTQPDRVIVMFHGYAVAKSVMIGEMKIFHELGWRTVLVDFRGSGNSAGMITSFGWHEARDVAAAVRWVRQEWPGAKLILYGQSMGGAAILRALALEDITADGIIIECVFDRMLTTIGHRYRAMNLPAFPAANLLTFWGGFQQDFPAFQHNPADYARLVSVPALVMGGECDPWVKPSETLSIAGNLKGPVRCKVFKGAGHGSFRTEVGEPYRALLRDWLNER